jgi:2'-5' RNA ligase
VPAFAECRPFELATDTPAITASKVRTSGWANMPIASRDRAWDGDAAAQRLATECGLDGDSPDWGCYASGFLYQYTDRDPQTRGAYAFPIVDHIDGEHQIVPAAVFAAANILAGGRGGTDIPADKQAAMRRVVGTLYKRLAKEFDDPSIQAPWGDSPQTENRTSSRPPSRPARSSGEYARMALLAAAQLGMPPEELFADPGLDRITPLSRRPLGNGWVHVFGHVAEHQTCLVGMRNVCLTPPYSEREYSQFHRYHRSTDGSVEFPLPVGRLTAGFGNLENTCRCCPGNDDHACANVSFGAAVAHHDRMQVLAYGRTGEDEKNNAIWFSGIEAPGVDERGRALLNRQKISGDWREVAGSMELSEILVLNRRNPGFPLPRVSVEGGRQRALTAAGVIHSPMERQMLTVSTEADVLNRRLSGDGILDYQKLGVAVAEALMSAAVEAGGDDDELAFNPNQRRGPDGKFIKMGGAGSAGGRARGRGRGRAGAGDGEGGDADGGRDAHNREIARLAKQVLDEDDDPDEDLDNLVTDLDDAIRSGNGAEADRLADEIRAQIQDDWQVRGQVPDAPPERVAAPATHVTARVVNAVGRSTEQQRAWGQWRMARREHMIEVTQAARDEQAGNDERDTELDALLARVQDVGFGDPLAQDAVVDELRDYLREEYGTELSDAPAPPAGQGMTAAAETHTGAMLALRMTEQDAARLCVTDGEPMEQLHLTLAYLGSADEIPPEVREKIEAEGRKLAASLGGPVTGDGFALNVFNPGTANDRDTALVLGVGGAELADIHRMVGEMNLGGFEMPEQHSPFVPHVTVQYTDDLDRVKAMADRIGPVIFDRLRMAFGGDVIDIPLGGLPTVGQGYDLVNAEMSTRARAAAAKLALSQIQTR